MKINEEETTKKSCLGNTVFMFYTLVKLTPKLCSFLKIITEHTIKLWRKELFYDAVYVIF